MGRYGRLREMGRYGRMLMICVLHSIGKLGTRGREQSIGV